MIGNVGLRLAPEALTPALARADLFLALDPHHDPRNKKAEAKVQTAIPIDHASLHRLFPQHLRTQTDLEYNTEKEKVIAITRDYFHDLILHEDPHGKLDPTRAAETLATALLPRARELFLQNDPAARLIARITIARHYAPDPAWPILDTPQLHQLLHDACTHKRSLADLTNSSALPDALRSTLPFPLDRQLDQLAPETITVPTGNKIKIDYPLPLSHQNSHHPQPQSSPSASRNSSASSKPQKSPTTASPSSSTSSPPATNPSKSRKTSNPSGPPPTSKSAKTSAPATPNTNGPKTPSPPPPHPEAAPTGSADPTRAQIFIAQPQFRAKFHHPRSTHDR